MVQPSPTPPPVDPSSPIPPPPGFEPKPPKRHHRLRWSLVSLSVLFAIILITGGWLVYRAISVVNTQSLDGSNQKLSFFQQITRIVTQNDALLAGESEDRINILLLGIGGPGHEGPYLTDTIIVASIQPSTSDVALLSIPRDFVVDIPGYDFRKVNNVLSIGRDSDYPGGGEALVINVLSDVLNIPIQYYARVDFTGFEEVIDRLGGIDVTVDQAFTDISYPDNNYGYQTIRFKAGEQNMDGDSALKFARSRKGNNGEGSDFARAARQQKIIVATRDKALSLGTLLNPVRITDLLGSVETHHQTNLEVWEILRLAKLVGDLDPDRVISRVLDNSQGGLLTAETGIGGAYILVPKDDSYGDIRFLAKNIFLIGQAEQEQAKVLVANATTTEGIASTTTTILSSFGLTTSSPISIRGTELNQTILLDHSQGKFPKTLELIGLYARTRGSITLAAWQDQTADETLAAALSPSTNQNANLNPDGESIDIVLILGHDRPTEPSISNAPSPTS